MKKAALVCFAFVLPLLTFAMPAAGYGVFQGKSHPQPNLRAWRLHEVQTAYFENTWIPSGREVLYYNSAHPAKLDSLEMYFYNLGEQTWQKHSVATYQTNAAGRTTASWYYDFWEGNYDLRERAEFLYDASNRLILEKWFDCDSSPEVLRYRENYFYQNDELSEFIFWEYDPWDQETEYYKNIFQNDPQGRPTEVLSHYSPDSLNWDLYYREELTYHPNDTSNGLTFIEYFSELMYEYGYLFSNITPWMWNTKIDSYWSSRAWQYENRDVYTYQIPNLELSEVIHYSWDVDWIPDTRDTYTYNNDGNLNWTLSWFYDGGNWTESTRNQYNWKTYSGSNDINSPVIPRLSLKAKPSPFADVLKILPTSPKNAAILLSIYNLKGQLIKRINATPGIETSWDGLDTAGKNCSSGIYFIKARQNHAEHTLRVIKLR